MSYYSEVSGLVPWNPDLFGAAYDINNPILPPPGQDPYRLQQQQQQQQHQQKLQQQQKLDKVDQYTQILEKKLAYMKSSRTALIVAVVILCILFLGALVGALLLAFPGALVTSVDIKVTSTRTDLTYTGDSATSVLVENTMCEQVKAVASSVANIKYCTVNSLENADPGVRAYIILKTALDGKSPSQVVAAVGEAIVRTAAVSVNWNVGPTDISVELPGYIPPRAISS